MQIVKTALVVMTLLLLLAAGAFMFMQKDSTTLSLGSDPVSVDLLMKTQVYIERQARLQGIQINTSFFDDTRFTSLQSYATPVAPQAVGKPNLFSPAASAASQVFVVPPVSTDFSNPSSDN